MHHLVERPYKVRLKQEKKTFTVWAANLWAAIFKLLEMGYARNEYDIT
jgi:hypothetical protein